MGIFQHLPTLTNPVSPANEAHETSAEIAIDDLPTWMRPRRRAVDWALLIALAFALLAASPLIIDGKLPRAAESFVYRSIQVARLTRQGVIYPRWAPDFHYTYGSPLFNYLAPLPHLLPGYHQAITQTRPTDSIRLMMILSFLMAGAGMYLFARRRWGAAAALIAALAFLFSGPIALNLPRQSGDLGLLMGLALLPWAAWAFDQVWTQPGRRAMCIAALALGLFLLTDARLAFLGSAALALVALSGRRLPGADSRGGLWLAGGVAAALALTAFFWLPALAELPAVRWLPSNLTYDGGPIPLTESLSLPSLPDPALLNPPNHRGLGIGLIALALLGGAALVAQRGANPDALLFLFFALLLLLLITPTFGHLWPDAQIFQATRPYHALLVAVFCLSMVAGQAALWLDRIRRDRTKATLFGLLALIGPLTVLLTTPPNALPALRSMVGEEQRLADSADREAADSEAARLAMIQAEFQTEQAGSRVDGVLLPATAPDLPEAPPNLLIALADDAWLPIRRESISGPSQVDLLNQNGLTWVFLLNLVQDTPLEFYLLHFPGWQAALGERPIALKSAPSGLIRLELSAVNDTLTVWFGSTPIRDLAEGVSLIALIGLLLALRSSPPAGETEGLTASSRLSRAQIAACALALTLVCCAALAFLLLREPRRPAAGGARLARGQIAVAATPLPRFLQGGVDLLAYDLPTDSVSPGGELRFSVYWQASRPMTEANQSEAWLFDPISRQIVARAAHRHPGGLPTLRWPLGRYVRDDFALRLPPNVPPGDYVLRVGIGACATRSILPCAQIAAMDAFTPFGEGERGGVTIPVVIRAR